MGPRINNRIFAKSVQVLDDDGANLGVRPTPQALQKASDLDLDLVEINAAQLPPIVKIMDFGKFKYEQKKKAGEARKKQKSTELKEVWMKPFIEDNDLNIKMKKVFEFLADGDKVKIAIAMKRGDKKVLARGRDFVPKLFEKLIGMIGAQGVLESKSKPDEKTKSIIIAPAK
jgi:translation initiation factor IF-3